VLAQVQDVLQYHLYALSAPLPKSRTEQSLAIVSRGAGAANNAENSTSSGEIELFPSEQATLEATAMLPPRERFWTTVSGSADVLTVLASTEVDFTTMTASVHVRVFNSSGFKVPSFALHLLVNGSALSVNRNATLPSFADAAGESLSHSGAVIAQHTLQSSLQRLAAASAPPGATTTASAFPTHSVWVDRQCVLVQPGVDFFLPDAYIERTFTCRVTAFAPFSVTVRVVYPDLMYDEDNIFEIPADSEGGNKAKRGKKPKQASGTLQAKSTPYLGEYRAPQSSRWSAVLDCAPLTVPVTALLLPYGYGSFSGMRHFAQAHRVKGGNYVHADLHEPGKSLFWSPAAQILAALLVLSE
jgi:hypothetical protein